MASDCVIGLRSAVCLELDPKAEAVLGGGELVPRIKQEMFSMCWLVLCQLDWATRRPGIWSNIILGAL